MESKLPAPPSMATTTSSRSRSNSAAPPEPSKLPLPSRRRSRLQSEEERDVSSSASTTSSPEVAVANGAMMAVPPRLELHELVAHDGEHARVCASSDADVALGRQVLADAADEFLMQCHQQQLLQQTTAVPRTGIPSLGAKKTHSQSRLTPGSTRLQTNDAEKQPSRIGRYEVRLAMVKCASDADADIAYLFILQPKKKPPPMIDTHWSSEVGDAGDHSGTDLSSASCTALRSDDATTHHTNLIPEHPKASERPEYIVTPAPAPPMTPPPVRIPHLHINGKVQGDNLSGSVVNDPKESQPLPRSPPMVQRLKTSVEPPKTPSGGPAFEAFNDDDESKLSASQRVRMGLSVLMTQGNGNANGAVSADMTRRKSHEEEPQRSQHGVAAPLSCPRLLQASSKQQQFAALKGAQLYQHRHHSQPRGSNLIASKLLPSRMCLNTLIEYVRELNQSAASLRVELEHTRQKADKELFEAHVQVSELQESLKRAKFDRDQARARAEEQEQLVRDLQAQVATLQQQVQAAASSFCQMEAFVSNSLQYETLQASASAAVDKVNRQSKVNRNEVISGEQATRADLTEVSSQQNQLQHDAQNPRGARNQQLTLSPRVVKPLWEPWSSGSDSPLTSAVNAPMFTIAPSGSDLLPSSPVLMPQASVSVANTISGSHDHELKSIVSPKNLMRAQERGLKPPMCSTAAATTENLAHTVPYTASLPVFSLAVVSVPELNELQMPTAVGGRSENGNLVPHAAEMETTTRQAHAEASSLSPSDLISPPTELPSQSHEDSGSHDLTPLMASAVPSKLFLPTQTQHSETPSLSTLSTESTAASLEKLLTDFFSQFDKNKLRMAGVYGKRYVGHEVKLFAELTRRYGKDKVAQLQHRYEESLLVTQVVDTSFLHDAHQTESLRSDDAPTAVTEATRDALDRAAVQCPYTCAAEAINSVYPNQAYQGTCTSAGEVVSGEPPTQKVSPRGRFRPNDHGFHVPSHAELPSLPEEESEVLETDVSSSYTSNGTSQLHPFAAAGDSIQRDAPSTSQTSEQSPPASPHRVAPQRRPTPFFPPIGDVVHLKTDAPPPLTREFCFANGGGTKSSPIRRQGEPSTGYPPLFSSSLNEMSDEKKTRAGPFLPSVVSSESVEVNKTVLAKPLVAVAESHVTMESLLKELYKKHQPDKLRNVAQIAKEYAGKERVLVRLLKAKYGALSVKRLEENLHVLENSVDRQKTVAEAKLKASKRKASVTRFLTRCALLSVTSLSLGGAGLTFLNSRECHSILSSSQSNTGTNSASCYKLNLGLEEFEFGRIPEYVGQSYSAECFCTNWVEREDAFLSSHSGGDLVNLAKMLPFSRGAVDAYLVDAPVRQYYTKYAQPVIEISKAYAPVIQSALAEVYGGVSARFSELQEQIFPFAAPLNESKNDCARETESAASALTKVARASKSLLDSLQEEEVKALVVDNQGASEEFGFTTYAEHKNDAVLEEKSASVEPALVEVAVLQEGVSISYTESRDLLDVAVDSVNSHPASNQDISLSDITTNADDDVRGGNSAVSGKIDASEIAVDRVAGETGQAAAGTAAEEVAAGGSEESMTDVGTIVDGKRLEPLTSFESSESSDLDALASTILKPKESVTTERTGVEEGFEGTSRSLPTGSELTNKLKRSSSKQMAIVHTKATPPDSQTIETPSEDGASPLVDSAVDGIEVIQTEPITEEVTSSSRLIVEMRELPSLDDSQQAHETISLLGADEAIIVNQAVVAESTERNGLLDSEEVGESAAIPKTDARESETFTVVKNARMVEAELAESIEHKQIVTGKSFVAIEERNPSDNERERPPAATEDEKSPAYPGHRDGSESSDLVNDDEDEDDDLDFGAELFNVDPWELLEMAERAAAAQLSTQKR